MSTDRLLGFRTALTEDSAGTCVAPKVLGVAVPAEPKAGADIGPVELTDSVGLSG